jgi:predicted house-cleaning NTP pyrophosphatase (Maf/HAM1 superfamily)
LRLALEKLASIKRNDAYVISADTVVAAGVRILPKTHSVAEAEKYLRLLSGRRHRVFTGIGIRAPDGRKASRAVTSIVGFARLDETQIAAYLASGTPSRAKPPPSSTISPAPIPTSSACPCTRPLISCEVWAISHDPHRNLG